MKKLLFLCFAVISSSQLFSQSAVGVPNFVERGLSADKWQVTDPERVQVADSRFIESKMLKGTQANLYFRSFRFSIPLTAIIEGIDVRVTRKKRGPNDVKDVTVALLKPINETEATGKGPNLAKPELWTETLTTVLYPFPKDAVDMDGKTFQWTPEEVNKAAFGLFFGTSVGFGKGAYILFDKVELTIRYKQATNVSTQRREVGPSSFIVIKQSGNRFQVKTEKEGTYLFTVRNTSGALLQQTSLQGGKSAPLSVEVKARGHCIITVEGPNKATSLQVYLQ